MAERSDDGFPSFADSVNITYLIAASYATCLTVFSRTSFGSQALGIGVGSLGVLMVGFLATEDLAVVTFGAVWFVALIVQRFITLRNWLDGWQIHSYYGGYPWATRYVLPCISDERYLRWCEPVLWVPVGLLGLAVSEGLGMFLLAGIPCLAIKTFLEDELRRQELRQLNDAEIEQESLVAQWETMRNGHSNRRDY